MPATKNKSKTPTTIRLDDDLKAEMLKDLEPMGISLNSYFNMAGRISNSEKDSIRDSN